MLYELSRAFGAFGICMAAAVIFYAILERFRP